MAIESNQRNFELPTNISGFPDRKAFAGEWTTVETMKNALKTPAPLKVRSKNHKKLCSSLQECLKNLDLYNGMTLSFHHHLRGGDETLLLVVKAISELGIKNITLASSSLTTAHEGLLPYLKDGTVTKIWTSGLRGILGKAVSEGILDIPVLFHSHGGRVRNIQTGSIKIDVAFIATSAADKEGNATGSIGKSAFGAMGYPLVDAEYARQVVVLTDNLVEYPCFPVSLPQYNVDYVVVVDRIGDPSKIASDTTRITDDPLDLSIAELTTKALDALGAIQQNFSFQTGAGGSSLAVSRYVREIMLKRKITGSFLLGGITSVQTEMLEEGLFKTIFDVQSFDAGVTHSVLHNPRHIEISAHHYANPFNCGCMTQQVDVVVLAALEVDVNFNVNVMVGSDGYIRAAIGGHQDAGSGGNLTVITVPSIRKGIMPIVRKTVTSIVTPGSSVDLIVTENCICVNPLKKNLEERIKNAGLPIRDIHELAETIEKTCPPQKEPQYEDKVVGLIEYRDGTIIDVVRKVKNPH